MYIVINLRSLEKNNKIIEKLGSCLILPVIHMDRVITFFYVIEPSA